MPKETESSGLAEMDAAEPSVTALRRWLYTAAVLRFFSGTDSRRIVIDNVKGR